MAAYYNEFDAGAAAWLRELIRRGLIADGEVDERSILDVRPVDLAGFTQCHFFAGIGGWSYALRLAGWPDDSPVWTGSPPCQPFSAAGLGLGRDDDRHLGPHFVGLVRSCRPAVLFGEQVASAAVFGKAASSSDDVARLAARWEADRHAGFPKHKRRGQQAGAWAWLDDLCDRLEAAHYAVGASDIPAAGIGAPNIRQRTFFGAVRMADAERGERGSRSVSGFREADDAQSQGQTTELARGGHGRRMAHNAVSGRGEERPVGGRIGAGDASQGWPAGLESGCDFGGLGDCLGAGLEGHRGYGDDRDEPGRIGADATGSVAPASAVGELDEGRRPRSFDGFWETVDWLYCRDERWRPVEPGTFPLAHGVSARVVRLRGYGNAIVPQVAAEFIRAFEEVTT